MVVIHVERCTGCGTCLDLCPSGALYLVEDKAALDEARCDECEACVPACPEEAILPVVEIQEPEAARAEAQPRPVPSRWPEPQVVHLAPPREPFPALRWASLAPAVGSALAVVGRQVLGRLVPYVLDTLEGHASRPARESQAELRGGLSGRRESGGRRQRQRRRGA